MNSTKVLKLQSHYKFSSSGSSGEAQPVLLPYDLIHREINHLASISGCRRRIVSLVPSQHIYGYLWTVLLPEALEIESVRLKRHTLLGVRPGDLIVGFPACWSRLDDQTWPENVWIASSGETLLRFPDGPSRCFDVYGSTETAGLALREDPSQPFELFPYWPDSLKGVDVPDRVAWEGTRHLRILGRKDGAVQVSGVNVYPLRIAAVLKLCPGVEEIEIRAMRPEEGRRLKAFVVGTTSEAELRRWAETRLSGPEQPGQYTFGNEIPRNGLGKVSDW